MDMTEEQLATAIRMIVGTRREQDLAEIVVSAEGFEGPNASQLVEAIEARRQIFRRGAAT